MPRFFSWKCHVSTRGNATSREKGTYRGNAMSRRVEISISTEDLSYTHAKYRVLPRVDTRVKMKL